MESTNKTKKIVIGLACLAVLVLIGFSIYQQRQLKELSQGAVMESDPVDESTGNAASDKGAAPQRSVAQTAQPAGQLEGNINDVEDLQAKLDATEQELTEVHQKLSDEAARKEELKQKQLELQKQYASDPSMKSSLKKYLDTAYADIFKELKLSPEELEKFKDILVNGQMALSEVSADRMNATTKEQKAELQKRVAEAREKNEAEIKEFLGSRYDTYHDYTEMATTRSVINGFKASLSEKDQLTEAQEKELTQIMYKEQMQVFAEIGYDPRKEIEFDSDVKSGAVDGQVKNMEKIHTRSVANSKGVLSASQLEQYEKYLKSQREMQEMYSKLSD